MSIRFMFLGLFTAMLTIVFQLYITSFKLLLEYDSDDKKIKNKLIKNNLERIFTVKKLLDCSIFHIY